MGYKTRGINDLYDQLHDMMTRYVIAIASLLGVYTSALAQLPAPQGIQGAHRGPGHTVGIRGSGFGITPGNLAVFFGAAKGKVTSATDQLVEAEIPSGATFDNITVTRIDNKLTGFTPETFLMSFGGDFGFDANNLGPQQDFPTEPGLFDQCLCDFNNDGLVDVATSSQNLATAAIFTNTSTVGTIGFSKNVITIPGKPLHARCGDLNSDGKPDLVFSEAAQGERIFVLQNITGNTPGDPIIFSPTVIVLTQTLKKPKQVQIADLDGDGKPEIIASDIKQTNGTGNVNIFTNQSSNGTMAFSTTPITLGVPGTISTDGLAVKDLNSDGRPEIITSKYADSNSNIFIAGNKSTPGNISFDAFTTITVVGGVSLIKVGDLDGDSKPDLAMTLLQINSVGVMRNLSTSTSFAFGSLVTYAADARPSGLDIGDLDGDGRADLVTASITAKTVTFLNNISSPGSFSFQVQTKATNDVNRHINLGDLDGDSKPDVVFTSVDNSNLSVFRNKTCMVPKISPEGPLTICSGKTAHLTATLSPGTTYEWKLGSSTLSTTANAYFDATAAGSYTVVAKAEGGTCVKTSTPVSLSVSGTGSGTVTIPPVPDACIGSSATLTANDPGTGLSFKWTGPDNYAADGAVVMVSDFRPVKAGRYFLDVYVGTGPGACLYQQLSTVVGVTDVGALDILYSNGTQMCQGNTKLLSVSNQSGFTYQWIKDGNNLGGETSFSYTANSSGDYTVKVKPVGCSDITLGPVTIKALSVPDASFTMPGTACQGQLVQFNNTSTVDPAATPVYTWTFGDSQTSNEVNPTHQYNSAAVRTITLKVEYAGCSDLEPKNNGLTITPAPSVQIINAEKAGVYKFCDGDSLKLAVSSTATFTNYSWSNGSSEATIFVKKGGIFSVNLTTTDGCALSDDQAITVDPAPKLEVTATPPQINEGESTQLEASAGLSNYHWTPDDGTLSAINTASPTATPLVTTTYLVSASSGAGCPGRGSIEVVVRGEPIVNKLSPGKFFSPNGDDRNPAWTVGRIEDFSQCGVSIYDDKGVKVYESKPYHNDWDGTFKGKKLPDGVYYYIIRCDGEEGKPRTGSITVLR